MVKCGLDVFLEQEISSIKEANVGLVANHASVSRDLLHISDLLISEGVRLHAMFGPEHGIRGDVWAGSEVTDGVDPYTGVRVFSLFGKHLEPTEQMLDGVDMMLIDLQDIGSRFYTYLYTMSAVMVACKQHSIPVCILDRPNPITGLAAEGFVLQPGYSSFVGRYPIAQRHSLTIGELALLFSQNFGAGEVPKVVPMLGWRRDMWFDETGLPWVMPSPNIPTLQTALVYSGTCLFEGTNVSEGRGTTRPFELIGTPWINSRDFKHALDKHQLPGVKFREAHFIPFHSDYTKQNCAGVQLYVDDPKTFRPVHTAVAMLCALQELYPGQFKINAPTEGIGHFDFLAGSSTLRESIESGKSASYIARLWQQGLEQYAKAADGVKLY